MDEKHISPDSTAALRRRAEALFLERSPQTFDTLSPEKARQLLHELQVHQIELEMQNEEMHRLQVEMDASRARYFDLYDLAPVGYLTVSEPGLILEANFTAAKMLGVSRRGLVKQPFTRFIAQADQDVFYLQRRQILETGGSQAFELRMRGREDQLLRVHLAATLAENADGLPELRIVLTDTTESKQAEERFNRQSRQLAAIVESSDAAIIGKDPDGIVESWNRGAEKIFGYTATEMVGQPVTLLFPPDRLDEERQILSQLRRGETVDHYETVRQRKDGRLIDISATISPVLDGSGKVIGLSKIARDITERKQAQEALASERNLLRTLMDLLPSWIFVKDRESRFLFANNACALNLGANSPEEMIGKTDADFFPPEIAEGFRREELKVFEGDPLENQETRRVTLDGAERILLVNKVPLRDSGGAITGLVGAALDITELKEAEAELRASEAFQRDILNSLPAHMAVLDPAGVILEVNEPWLQFARDNGAPPSEAIGVGANYLKVCQLAWQEDDAYAKAAVEGLESVLAGKQPRFILEYPCDAPDCARWFSMEVLHLGNAEGAIVAHTDISERKKAEEALRDADQKLRLHFEQTPMGVIEWDLDFRVTRWNPAACTIFGHTREEALGQHASFIVPKAYHHRVDEIWQALLHKSGGEKSTNPNVSKEGTSILCEWYNTPLIDERGTVRGVASVVLDITRQTHDQQLLAWEKSALEAINSEAPLDTVLNALMLGLEEQLPGGLCSVLLLDGDGVHLRLGAAPSLPEAYSQALDGLAIGPAATSCGAAAHAKRQVIVADIGHDPLWADYRELALEHGLHACWSTPIFDDSGKVLATFAIAYREPCLPAPAKLEMIERAVHVMSLAIERKKSEEEILQLNARLERRVEERTAALQAANASLGDFKHALDEHAVVSITDEDGTITYANDKFCRISKYPREDLLGRNHRIIESAYHPPAFFEGLWQTVIGGEVWKDEIKNRAKDGTIFWVNCTIVPFLGPDGNPTQFIAISTEITELKVAEEKINKLNTDLQSRAAQLEAANKELEAFSYSVSHDLRAPLRALDGFSRMVLADYAPKLDDEGRRMLGVIHNEAQRMGQLIDDLLAFSRLGRQPIGSARIDMEGMARDIFQKLAALEPERQVRCDPHPLPPAFGTEAMVRQVWVNLIGNALKFTKQCEVAEIGIGAQEGASGEWVYFVKDNGVGFDMRYVDKLFGVFQRLHSQTEFPGTGVGLALVQRIVQRHGGRIWAEAEVNRGATFYFTLPNQKS
jgi:PAS domain S-box-containing protein